MKNRSIIKQGVTNLLPNTERTLDLISIDRIFDNPYQPRTINVCGDDFDELKNSIKSNGLDTPILVIRKGKKDSPDYYNFILVQGQRRLLAIKKLGFEHILANILEFDEEYIQKQLPVHSLIENIQRQSLHFLDELKSLYLIANRNFGITIVNGNYYQADEKISILSLAEKLYQLVYIKPEYLRKKLSLYLQLHNNPDLQQEIIKKKYKLPDILLNKNVRESLFKNNHNPSKKRANLEKFQKTLTKLQQTSDLSGYINGNKLILPYNPGADTLQAPKQNLKVLKKMLTCYTSILDQLIKGDFDND